MNQLAIWVLILFVTMGVETEAFAKTVRYELTAERASVNLSGKESVDFALMMNGSIPAPTLEFTEGDEAEILVKNRIPGEELSIHWHGILLPPEMDGVPYVTTPPIHSGQDYTFRFKIRQSGTYWYHSHTNVQEQKGLYGAFVIRPKEKKIKYDREITLVLSDWSDENASDILKNLRKDGDYYLYKKDTMRSWWGAIRAGSLKNFLYNEWTRMGGMDYSDVGYDAFLINGKKNFQLADVRRGEKIRLRIINAAASTYFYVALGNTPMKVISADGIDIEPMLASEILMGMAETYDVLFEVPEQKNYEFRVTAQDGTGTASVWMGSGASVAAPVKPFPDMYALMDHSAHQGHEAHVAHQTGNAHQHSSTHHHGDSHHPGAQHSLSRVETLTVDEIRASKETALPKNAQVHEVRLELGGNMARYVWYFNNKTIQEDRTIEIQEGDIVRFTLVNQTMMHHPMHLHGHFFRVLNKNGVKSPLKHTVDVPPHMTRTIEFYANEPGEWMLHCHNLFHLKTGMARVVKYSSFTPKPEIAHLQKHDPHLHDHWYSYGMLEAASNHGQAYFRLSQSWNQIEARFETRNTTGKNLSFKEEWEVEADLLYRRWVTQYLNLVGGATLFDKRYSGVAGISYVLPFLVETQALIDHRGKFRFDIEKRFQWTKVIYSDVDVSWRPLQGNVIGEDLEYEISLMFSPSWSWAAGLMLTDDNIGVGAHFQF